MRARVRVATPLMLTLAVACASACTSLLSGEEFTGGPTPTDGGGGEGAVTPGAAGTDRAGSSDSGPGPDAGSMPFCAAHASSLFCDDFDDRLKPYQQVWPNEFIQGASSVALSSDQRTSAPNSLLITSSAPDGALGSVSRDFTFGRPVTDVTVEMSVYFDKFAPEDTAGATMMTIFFGETPTASSMGVRILLNHVETALRQQQEYLVYPADGGDGTFIQNDITPPIASGRWVRLRRHITLGTTPTATVSADDVVISKLPLPPDFVPAATMTVLLGFQYDDGPTSPTKLWTDDVLVEAH